MNASPLNLRRLFSLPDEGTVAGKTLRDRLAGEVKTIKWPAAMPDLAAKIGELFDVELPDLFVASWKKSLEIKEALRDSKTTPHEPRSIELAEHVWRGDFHPFIEVRVKGVPVKRLQFTVEISATLQEILLWIENGAMKKIEAGSCEFAGRIKYEDLLIAEKKSTVPLPLRDIVLIAN